MLGKKIVLPALLMLAIATLALPARSEEPKVQIREITVETKPLAKAIEKRDAAGRKQTFSQVTVVHLRGTFPPPMDTALDFFLGDTKIPEYGTTADGIYFKVYDPALLERHRGQELRYRFGSGAIQATGMRFDPTAATRP